MKELIQLAESIGALAKLPETTRELIQAQHNVINMQSARIQNLENRLPITSHVAKVIPFDTHGRQCRRF